MGQHAFVADKPAISPDDESLLQRLTPCDQTALSRLTRALDEAGPAAFLIGAGRARSSKVIDSYLAAIDNQTMVVRIVGPCEDATSCMRNVIRSIGFEPDGLGLADLENVFKMFLSFQRTHGRRTVICIEEAQECSSWVLEKVFELSNLEMKEKYGLLVILSGRRNLTPLFSSNTLHSRAARTVRHIQVAPLTPAETQEFVVQQIKSANFDDAGQIIEFDAIRRLHKISAGIPDTLNSLCNKSLQLAANEAAYPITESVVIRAARSLRLIPVASPQATKEPVTDGQVAHGFGRFIVRLRGRRRGRHSLTSDCFSIGRDSRNECCIPSLFVSRHHLLIVRGSAGIKLMDLGSTNGTTVNGENVDSRVLRDGDRIGLGDCQIEYVAADRVLDVIDSAEVFSKASVANKTGYGSL